MSAFVFEATMNNITKFRRVLEAIKDLVNEVNLSIDSSGIIIQTMDNSHVALVNANIKSEGFSSYSCTSPIILGINLEKLIKIIKFAGDQDSITMKAEPTAEKLNLHLENISKSFLIDRWI